MNIIDYIWDKRDKIELLNCKGTIINEFDYYVGAFRILESKFLGIFPRYKYYAFVFDIDREHDIANEIRISYVSKRNNKIWDTERFINIASLTKPYELALYIIITENLSKW